jgi:hypothetical protein
MRNYWLKIFAGALGIFVIGMAAVTMFRSVRSKVTHTLNSTDPIPIPLIGLVPFRLDSERLGSLRRVEFLRSDPQHVSGIRVVVALADSVTPDRLRSCQIALDDAEDINDKTTFRCQAPGANTAALEPFGEVALDGDGGERFTLLLPTRAVQELRETSIHLDHGGLHIDRAASRQEAARARIDSIREAIADRKDARADSIDALKDKASELEDSAAGLGSAARRRVQHSADSVRGEMRAMIDRMKVDEAQLKSFPDMGGLTPAQVDSLAHLGDWIRDSVQRTLDRELRSVRPKPPRGPVQVEATTPVPAAPPAPPPKP